jgi:tetratricopeptide (TPR) repeat protein
MTIVGGRVERVATYVLLSATLIYAFCAGLRTIGDFDFGWQIATGRYIAQHHQIPRLDVLSFTVPGAEWLYPPFAELIFYWLYLLGGYAALSLLLAIATVTTIAVMLRRGGLATAVAAMLAVPSIVFRENPRAELFSTLLFAVYLLLLWRYFREGRGRLWLFPLLMLLWVNLHPGFIAGLGLLGGYVLMEICELPFSDRRKEAQHRLRKFAPWLAASIAVTICNPWGPGIYAGILRQNRSVKELGDFIGEWSRPNLSSSVFHQMIRLRDPESSFWWLLVFVVIAIGIAIWRKQIGPAILLAGAAFLSIQYLRFQGLFACVAVIVGGAMLDELSSRPESVDPTVTPGKQQGTAIWRAAGIGLSGALLILGIVRCSDLITNRHYVEAGEVVLFGPGEAAWFPERAAEFIVKNRLPGNLFNDYNLGGFLEWRLPEYKAYVDSRAIPFGVELLNDQRTLLRTPLDSSQWTQEAERRNLNFVILSLDRYTGLGKVPLQDDCHSRNWRPVYLDETSAVFLRNSTQNADLIRRLAIDCATARLIEPEYTHGNSYRAKGNAYNFLANAGSVFYVLGRDAEARQYLARAEQIEPHDANLHLTLAQLFQADGQLQEAEREYKESIAQRPTDFAWYLLGVLYGKQQRYPEAVEAITRSAEISYNPADRYRIVAQIQNVMQEPKAALSTFDRAERIGSHGNLEDRKIFAAQLASGRAKSWELLHDLNRAVEEQRKSVELLPNDAGRWAALANLYREQGDAAQAAQAQSRSESLIRPSK